MAERVWRTDFKSFSMCTMGRYRCPRTCVGVWAATAIATASAAAAAVVTPWPEPVADEKWAGTLSMMKSGLAKVVPLNLTLSRSAGANDGTADVRWVFDHNNAGESHHVTSPCHCDALLSAMSVARTLALLKATRPEHTCTRSTCVRATASSPFFLIGTMHM
jgi:hypothetical protein